MPIAIKIVKSANHYTEAARDEVKILNTTTRHDKDNASCVIHLLDSFDVEGPHGTRILFNFTTVFLTSFLHYLQMLRWYSRDLAVICWRSSACINTEGCRFPWWKWSPNRWWLGSNIYIVASSSTPTWNQKTVCCYPIISNALVLLIETPNIIAHLPPEEKGTLSSEVGFWRHQRNSSICSGQASLTATMFGRICLGRDSSS